MMHLTPQPARTDLTDRECARIIGGLLGSLAGMTTPATVRRAVKWWAESNDAWAAIGQIEARAVPTAPRQEPTS